MPKDGKNPPGLNRAPGLQGQLPPGQAGAVPGQGADSPPGKSGAAPGANPQPVAVDDFFYFQEDALNPLRTELLRLTEPNAERDVEDPELGSDQDPGGGSLSIVDLNSGALATDLEIIRTDGFDDYILWTPERLDYLKEGETEQLTFTYSVADDLGKTSDPATVTIAVIGQNDTPTVSGTVRNANVAPGGVVVLSISSVADPDAEDSLSVVIELTSSVEEDTLDFSGFEQNAPPGITVTEGTDRIEVSGQSELIEAFFTNTPYTMVASADPTARAVDVTVTVTDGFGATASSTTNVTVGTQPPDPQPDSYSVDEDGVLVIPFSALLDNDMPQGAGLVVAGNSDPGSGTITPADDGVGLVYRPNQDFVGDDGFTYTVQNAAGATAIGQVNLQVLAQNDPPDDLLETILLTEDTSLLQDNLLKNASDVDHTRFELKLTTINEEPLLEIPDLFKVFTLDDGSILSVNRFGDYRFFLNRVAYQYLDEGESIDILVNGEITDPDGATSTARFVFSVAGVDDPVQVPDGPIDVLPGPFNLADVFSDPDDDIFVEDAEFTDFSGDEPPNFDNGIVDIAEYLDRFKVGEPVSITAQVSLFGLVEPVEIILEGIGTNDPPTNNTNSVSPITFEDTDLVITPEILREQIIDPDTEVLDFLGGVPTTLQGGTLGAKNGELVYTPPADYFGTDLLTVQVTDRVNDPVTLSFDVRVFSVDDLPTLEADKQALGLSVGESGQIDFTVTDPDNPVTVSFLTTSFISTYTISRTISDANWEGPTPTPSIDGLVTLTGSAQAVEAYLDALVFTATDDEGLFNTFSPLLEGPNGNIQVSVSITERLPVASVTVETDKVVLTEDGTRSFNFSVTAPDPDAEVAIAIGVNTSFSYSIENLFSETEWDIERAIVGASLFRGTITVRGRPDQVEGFLNDLEFIRSPTFEKSGTKIGDTEFIFVQPFDGSSLFFFDQGSQLQIEFGDEPIKGTTEDQSYLFPLENGFTQFAAVALNDQPNVEITRVLTEAPEGVEVLVAGDGQSLELVNLNDTPFIGEITGAYEVFSEEEQEFYLGDFRFVFALDDEEPIPVETDFGPYDLRDLVPFARQLLDGGPIYFPLYDSEDAFWYGFTPSFYFEDDSPVDAIIQALPEGVAAAFAADGQLLVSLPQPANTSSGTVLIKGVDAYNNVSSQNLAIELVGLDSLELPFAPVVVDDRYNVTLGSAAVASASLASSSTIAGVAAAAIGVDAGQRTTVSVLDNDTDANNDIAFVTLVVGPDRGTFELFEDGSFIFDIDPTETGFVSFTYRTQDETGFTSTIGTAMLALVSADNTAPVANGDVFEVRADGQTIVADGGVLENDVDDQGDPLQATLVGLPEKGLVALNPAGGFTYVAFEGQRGFDSFSYTALDPAGLASAETTVSLAIVADGNTAPMSFNDGRRVLLPHSDTRFSLPFMSPIDDDGDPILITVTALPSFGQVTLEAFGPATPLAVGDTLTSGEMPFLFFAGQDAQVGDISSSLEFELKDPAGLTTNVSIQFEGLNDIGTTIEAITLYPVNWLGGPTDGIFDLTDWMAADRHGTLDFQNGVIGFGARFADDGDTNDVGHVSFYQEQPDGSFSALNQFSPIGGTGSAGGRLGSSVVLNDAGDIAWIGLPQTESGFFLDGAAIQYDLAVDRFEVFSAIIADGALGFSTAQDGEILVSSSIDPDPFLEFEAFVIIKDLTAELFIGEAKLDRDAAVSNLEGQQGYSVDVLDNTSEDIIAVSSPGDNLVDVWISETDINGFAIAQTITAPLGTSRFGEAVLLFDDYLVVGAPQGDAGTVFVYLRDVGGKYQFLQELIPSGGMDGDLFGSAMDFAGGVLYVGAPGTDGTGVSNSGAVYQFDLDVNGLFEVSVTRANPTPEVEDAFGSAVAAWQESVAISARGDDSSGVTNSGAVYVFGGDQVSFVDLDLTGGVGDDVLISGLGNDTMFGDLGADIFVFTTKGGIDLVSDYTDGTDKLGFLHGDTNLQSISVTAGDGGTGVFADGIQIAKLGNVAPETVTIDDFVFV